MMTRAALIHTMAKAMDDQVAENPEKVVDTHKMATVALDALMDELADPLCQILEGAPFGVIAIDKIREIAGR